jgi:hypothetical protein
VSCEESSPSDTVLGPLDEFLAILMKAEVDLLIDVRRYPGSRRHPQFSQDRMSISLPEHGISLSSQLCGRRAASGSPSTAHAIAGRDSLQATAAAGSLFLPDPSSRRQHLVAAVPTHIAISMVWTYLLCLVLPRRRRAIAGAAYGAAFAILDLQIIGAAVPRIRALPIGSPIADQALFGAVVGIGTRTTGGH